ncbi:hypothetical protein [Streptomyces sp. NPDC058955]|uniref:hypothetical protein n=1 Tax=unclassified Streptomyces TaxID=2593676 RepID=UPI003656CF79
MSLTDRLSGAERARPRSADTGVGARRPMPAVPGDRRTVAGGMLSARDGVRVVAIRRDGGGPKGPTTPATGIRVGCGAPPVGHRRGERRRYAGEGGTGSDTAGRRGPRGRPDRLGQDQGPRGDERPTDVIRERGTP